MCVCVCMRARMYLCMFYINSERPGAMSNTHGTYMAVYYLPSIK